MPPATSNSARAAGSPFRRPCIASSSVQSSQTTYSSTSRRGFRLFNRNPGQPAVKSIESDSQFICGEELVEARLQHNPLDCDVRPFVVVYKCNKAIVNLLCWANQKFVCRCDRSARALHHLHEPCRPIRRPQSQTRLIDPVDGPLFSGCPLPLHGPFSTALWVLSRPRSLPNRLK